MSSLLRALRKRLKANPPPMKPSGKFYAGNIESVSIDGHTFPVVDDRSITVFKPRSTGFSIMMLEQFAQHAGVVGDGGAGKKR